MAPPVFSTRFIRFTGVATPAYVVPAGFVAVVRQLTYVGGGPGINCAAAYGDVSAPLEAFFQAVQAANTVTLFDGRIVLDEGESFFMSSAAAAAMTAHGYKLSK